MKPMVKTAKQQSGLKIENLTKKFGDFTALDNVDLQINRGEFLTLLGPSGSGKTTLLMSIAGFETISSGDISLDGHLINNLPAQKRNFGMVFQGYALFPHMSVVENIAYPLEIRKYEKARQKARVQEMLELVQLQEFADRLPRQLSGGQQQRVALARALSFAPQILLLDEPLGALDKKLRTEVQRQLKEIHNRVKTTFIYVTHDQEEALSMSDRIVILRDGGIVQIGTPQELYEKPKTVFAADFLGKSNFITAQIDQVIKDKIHYKIGDNKFIQTSSGIVKQSDNITIALRPEKIELVASNKQTNKINGKIIDIAYFGSLISLSVMVESLGEIMVDVDLWRAPQKLEIGANILLSWSDDAGVLVKSEMNKDG